jgi:restriction system protein
MIIEYFNIYWEKYNQILNYMGIDLYSYGYFINESIFILFNILILTLIPFILIRKRKRWRVKSSYKYLKKIESIQGENEFIRGISYLRKIDPFIYEEMILSRLKLQGCNITRNKRYTGDGGIDGKFKHKGQKYLIQAKRYSNHIKLQDVKDFKQIASSHKSKALFVHTGKTGKGSKDQVDSEIVMLSGQNMFDFLKNKKHINDILK